MRHILVSFFTINTMLNFDVDAQCEQGLMLVVTLINSEKTLQEILQIELNSKKEKTHQK